MTAVTPSTLVDIKLQIPAANLQLVVNALEELPHRVARSVIDAIVEQSNAFFKAASEAPITPVEDKASFPALKDMGLAEGAEFRESTGDDVPCYAHERADGIYLSQSE